MKEYKQPTLKFFELTASLGYAATGGGSTNFSVGIGIDDDEELLGL